MSPGDAQGLDRALVATARRRGIGAEDASRLAGLLSLLSDPVRVRLLYSLDLVDELCVGDRGPGIPIDERTRVFEKFYRLPQTQPAGLHGAGLGLAICKGVVEAHGGEITLLDRAGGGTLVTVRLPLDVVDTLDKEQTRWPQPTY